METQKNVLVGNVFCKQVKNAFCGYYINFTCKPLELENTSEWDRRDYV